MVVFHYTIIGGSPIVDGSLSYSLPRLRSSYLAAAQNAAGKPVPQLFVCASVERFLHLDDCHNLEIWRTTC